FNDAIMDDRHLLSRMRMGVIFGWTAMCGPACVADACDSGQRMGLKTISQIGQLALSADPRDVAILKGGDTGTVISAIFKPAQRIHKAVGNGGRADNSNDSAH